jgi:acetolactate synthase small subunit
VAPAQVTGVFARRGYNVQSLAVGPGEREGLSRITMVVPGSNSGIANLLKQLNKLVAVQAVTDLTDSPYVSRELMMVKVCVCWGGEAAGRARPHIGPSALGAQIGAG